MLTTALVTAALLLPPPALAAGPDAGPSLTLPLTGRIATPDKPTAIMPLADVRIGMKGYGLSVFHRTEIEPFPVEVVSVISDSSPGRGTVWIRCTDARMQKSGPVQGMSGSPIFLWDGGEEGEIGEGGRLIGAFAFGYALSKDCLVGVQPIEYMRLTGSRAAERAENDPDGAAARAATPGHAATTLATLQQIAESDRTPAIQRYGLDATATLIQRVSGQAAPPPPLRAPAPPRLDRAADASAVRPMLLPLAIGNAALAKSIAPLLAPAGMTAVASDTDILAGAPPAGTDAETAIQPGAVLAVPLAFGDLDLSATGTVTDVLPDGTVLGFGHPMFGQGATAVPMASGYVHFVVPSLNTSFKRAGSLKLAGSIVQDEAAAVAGVKRQTFSTAPVEVEVAYAGQEPKRYRYRIVNHPVLGPVLASSVAAQSVLAIQGLPVEATTTITGTIRFSGGRSLPVHAMVVGNNPNALNFEIVPPLAAVVGNPFEPVEIDGIDLRFDIEPTIRAATLVRAVLDNATAEPGDTVGITLRMQPHGAPAFDRRIEVKVPLNTAEGEYPLSVVDGASYAGLLLQTRPHLQQITGVDDLIDAMVTLEAVRSDRIYAVLALNTPQLAVGREPLPDLPASKRVLFSGSASTAVTSFPKAAETIIESDYLISGAQQLTLKVRRDATESDE